MLKGIQNFLQFLNDNWTAITVIIALALALYGKIRSFLKKSNAEKIEIAKVQAKEIILKWVTDAEMDYETWTQAGAIKRSQVIKQIYDSFPALAKFAKQDEIIKWIDETINTSLKDLRKIVAENLPKEDETGDDSESE
jgi:hypothetical protein